MDESNGTPKTYTYDNTAKRRSVSGPEGTLTYTYYDTNDLLHTVTDYAGDEFVFHYDSLNRLTNVVDQFTNNTFYAFDAAGNLQTARYPNSVTNT